MRSSESESDYKELAKHLVRTAAVVVVHRSTIWLL